MLEARAVSLQTSLDPKLLMRSRFYFETKNRLASKGVASKPSNFAALFRKVATAFGLPAADLGVPLRSRYRQHTGNSARLPACV